MSAARPRLACAACGRPHAWSLAGACTSCAGLLEVEYDLGRARIGREGAPMQRFRDLLPLCSPESLLDTGEGNTRCLHARELGRAIGLDNLWVKVEGDNPTRTVKDRQGTVAIAALRELGVTEFVTASTGNSCTAMARVVARFPDMHMHAFVGDEFLDRVAYSDTPNVTVYWLPNGSFVEACEAASWFAAQRGLTREAGFFFHGKREGLKTVYLEAAMQVTGEIEVYVQAVSSGIGVYAADRAARELQALGHTRRTPSYVCVQESACDPMVRSFARGAAAIHPDDIVARPRGLAKATFRGDPTRVYPYIRRTVLDSHGTMTSVPTDAVEPARERARQTQGLDICHASALTIAAAADLARSGRIRRDAVVLLNLTGGNRPPSARGADFVAERSETGWSIRRCAPSPADVTDGVIETLRRSLHLAPDLPLDADTVLLERGLALDSVAVLELLLALEQRFERRIDEHELTLENLATVGALARLLATKLAASRSGHA